MVNNNRDDYYYSVGGRIQFGEAAEQAIKREVKEELGCEMEVDRLGFICEAYFYGTIGDDQERLIYEPAFYFYMKVPDDFDLQGNTFLEDGTPESLEYGSLPCFVQLRRLYPETFLLQAVIWTLLSQRGVHSTARPSPTSAGCAGISEKRHRTCAAASGAGQIPRGASAPTGHGRYRENARILQIHGLCGKCCIRLPRHDAGIKNPPIIREIFSYLPFCA